MIRRFFIALVLFAIPSMLVAQTRPAPIVSPEIHSDGKVTFRLRASQAKSVSLQGQWSKQQTPLAKGEGDIWAVTADSLPAGVWEYSFQVDGLNVMDSRNPTFKPQREPSKSILHIPGSPPNPWDWQDVPHGTVHQHGYLSKGLGRPRELWVYTPPGYEKSVATNPGTRYPLLVLQHGSGDNHQTWVVHGKAHWILDNLIAAKRARPMIVVMLDGHPMGMVSRDSAPQKRGAALDAFRNELFDDALPLVEATYQVERDAANRAIAGLSMGGGQSLGVGLANLDRFSWVAAFSAGPPSPETTQTILTDPSVTNSKLKLLWIGCGKDDAARQRNEEFIATLKEKDIRHVWHLTPGDHSWPVWRGYLSELVPKLFQTAVQ